MDTDGYIPPSALTACREARMQGHAIYICSGRPCAIINERILSIGFDGVISSGGAHIEIGNTAKDLPFHGEVIFDVVMDTDIAKRISSFFSERRCGFSLEKNYEVFSNRFLLDYLEDCRKQFIGTPKEASYGELIGKIKRRPLIEDLGDDVYINVNKVVFTGSPDMRFSDVTERFSRDGEIFRGSIKYFGNESGEISPAGINKGSGLKAIADYHGLTLESTIAIGDSDNDSPMIKCAGMGIAMGNADDELKAIAGYVTTPLREDGIFNAFKKCGII